MRRACALLQINRSTFYKSLKPSQKVITDKVLAKQIATIQDKHKGCYGIERMTGELRRQGIMINHKRVARIMRLYKLNAIIRKKRNYFCNVERVPRKELPSNLLNRDFHADKPGEKLVSDVTYLPTSDGQWCYASLVKDLCTSEIVACATGRSQTIDFGLRTIELLKGSIKAGALFHTDQGFMYTHPIFSLELEKLGVVQSLSRKGNCLDNAVIESFNGTMKCEWFYPRLGKGRWNLSFEEVSQMVFEYVKYYNEERIQKKLGYLTPVEYRRQITQNQ